MATRRLSVVAVQLWMPFPAQSRTGPAVPDLRTPAIRIRLQQGDWEGILDFAGVLLVIAILQLWLIVTRTKPPADRRNEDL